MEELTIYEGTQAVCKVSGMNYKVTSPLTGNAVTLERDTDFGMVPKTNKPTLFKSGAEKVCMAYGLMQRYAIESKIEHYDPNGGSFFYYLVRCDLVKIANNGQEYVFASAFGSANTCERNNGFAGAFDAANKCAKMAQKRSLTAAALSVSGLSAMFTQDIESDVVTKNYNELAATAKDDSPITTAQMKRIFAIANINGYNAKQAKDMIVAAGYASTKSITQKDYEKVCDLFKPKDE